MILTIVGLYLAISVIVWLYILRSYISEKDYVIEKMKQTLSLRNDYEAENFTNRIPVKLMLAYGAFIVAIKWPALFIGYYKEKHKK